MTVDEIIDQLHLSPHPEGGYFREVYRADGEVNRETGSSRSAGTGIYFLLPAAVCTNWHRVNSDELWHFYQGDALKLEIIDERGNFKQYKLHNNFSDESTFQALVPQNCWQRAYSLGEYSLVGCTVSPGFEFDDFEMVESQELISQFPDFKAEILRNPFSNS